LERRELLKKETNTKCGEKKGLNGTICGLYPINIPIACSRTASGFGAL
jgi:hypothetical protein